MSEASDLTVWVCDGCMGRVVAHEIADFADFEHVICRRCVQRDRGEASP